MGLDTKYRPITFDEVLGQDSTIEILQKLLENDQAYQQSYLFGGPSGTGKTTIARIFARAMLCENGNPCNDCETCRDILEGSSMTFQEMDAANHSSKEDVERMLEEMDYYTLGGKTHRIYLLDEAHSLSTAAMDALLKPLEDEIPGTNDKRMVCLFCTTEPENVRKTIRSRSMVFQIRQPPVDEVYDRLVHICEQEKLEYEEDAVRLIMDHARGHLRDMLVSLDRVARTGPVTVDSTKRNLGLSTVDLYYEILIRLSEDIDKAVATMWQALDYTDAQSLASGIGQAALNAYKIQKGIEPRLPHIVETKAKRCAEIFGENTLFVARRFLSDDRTRDANALMCRLLVVQEEIENGFVRSQPMQPSENENTTVKNDESERSVQMDNQEDSSSDDSIERAREEASELGRFGAEGVKQGGPEVNRSPTEDSTTNTDNGEPDSLHRPDEQDYEAALNRFMDNR